MQVKISELSNASLPLVGNEIVLMDQNGVTVTSPLSNISGGSSGNFAVKDANNHFTTTQTISGDLTAIGNLNVGGDLTAIGNLNVGVNNIISGTYSSVAGGCSNIVGGNYSSILGGYSNCICATATCSSILAGTGITALSADTSYTPSLILTNVPTASAVGMTSGTIWRCTTTNVLYIMP